MNTEQMNRLGTRQNGSGRQVVAKWSSSSEYIIYTGSNAQNLYILAEMLMSPCGTDDNDNEQVKIRLLSTAESAVLQCIS